MNMGLMVVAPDTYHFEMSLLNDSVWWNMEFMVVTPDTSHFEMSLLNNAVKRNRNMDNDFSLNRYCPSKQNQKQRKFENKTKQNKSKQSKTK